MEKKNNLEIPKVHLILIKNNARDDPNVVTRG